MRNGDKPPRGRRDSAWLDLLYPERCAFCGRVDRLVAGSGGCCRACLALLPHRRGADRTLFCELPHPDHTLPARVAVVAAMHYEPPIREALLRFKFNRDVYLAAALGALAARAARQAIRAGAVPPQVVAAVPLHRARQRERGFNQAALLTAEVAARLRLPDASAALARTRATARQSSARGRAEREANLHGAFAVVDPLAFRGRVVWLVDDVLTTGATIGALAHALMPYRPSAILGLVVASSRPPDTLR